MTTKLTFVILLLLHYSDTIAQSAVTADRALALEARVTTYLQGGYDLGLFYYPKNTRFSVGALLAGHPIRGAAKELLFNSSNHDALRMRLVWLTSLQTRYHFAAHREGFFAEGAIGLEAFRVSAADQSQEEVNGFVAPAVGYIWYPWQRDGFYLLPKVNAVFTLFRAGEQTVGETSYRLKPFFATPSLAVGWKF